MKFERTMELKSFIREKLFQLVSDDAYIDPIDTDIPTKEDLEYEYILKNDCICCICLEYIDFNYHIDYCGKCKSENFHSNCFLLHLYHMLNEDDCMQFNIKGIVCKRYISLIHLLSNLVYCLPEVRKGFMDGKNKIINVTKLITKIENIYSFNKKPYSPCLQDIILGMSSFRRMFVEISSRYQNIESTSTTIQFNISNVIKEYTLSDFLKKDIEVIYHSYSFSYAKEINIESKNSLEITNILIFFSPLKVNVIVDKEKNTDILKLYDSICSLVSKLSCFQAYKYNFLLFYISYDVTIDSVTKNITLKRKIHLSRNVK